MRHEPTVCNSRASGSTCGKKMIARPLNRYDCKVEPASPRSQEHIFWSSPRNRTGFEVMAVCKIQDKGI